MPLNYQVAARVVDARGDKPKANDRWLVDTNVLFWASYTPGAYAPAGPKYYQQHEYNEYLKKVQQAGGALVWCGLSFAEIAHRIELTEFEIARHAGATRATNAKEYRHSDRKEWERITGEIEAAWSIVNSLAQPLQPGITIDEAATKQGLVDLKTCGLGGYDIFLLQVLRSANITGLISDDGDFCTARKITLVTANTSVLAAARAQNRILGR